MAGEPLLYKSTTGLIVVDEPSRSSINHNVYQSICDSGVAIARAATFPVLDLRAASVESSSFVLDETLTNRIKAMKRRALIVCGALLEGAVTQVSLSALMDGYDVFVPADLVATGDPENITHFLARITSCGGNILTCRQVILELLSGLKERDERSALEDLMSTNLPFKQTAKEEE